jgi:hypothetical protein
MPEGIDDVLAGRIDDVHRIVAGVEIPIALFEVARVIDWVVLGPTVQGLVVPALPKLVQAYARAV